MFDFAFSELTIVAVIALVVIGPKRLPVVARVAGKIFGQVNRYVSQVKREVEKEMQLAEIAELKKGLQEKTSELKKEFTNINSELNNVEQKIEKEMQSIAGATPGEMQNSDEPDESDKSNQKNSTLEYLNNDDINNNQISESKGENNTIGNVPLAKPKEAIPNNN